VCRAQPLAPPQAQDTLTGLGNLTDENRLALGALVPLVGLFVGASPPVTAAKCKAASEVRDAITRSVQTAMTDVLGNSTTSRGWCCGSK
jgi:hypothetical protein